MQTLLSKENVVFAGFFCRFAALLIDGVLVSIGLLIVKIPVWIINLSVGDSFLFQPFLFKFSIFDVIYYLLTVTYFVLMTYFSGATVGKHLMKIKVIDTQGEKPSFLSVLIRETVGRYLSALIINIGYIIAAFDDRKQGMHDRIADTYVVYTHLR